MVGIDHQCDVGPDRFPHGARHRGIFFHAEADLEFYRLEAFRDITGRLLGKIAQRIARFAPVQSGRIGLHLAAKRAAEQAMHGNAEVLSLDVPQRDVDAAQPLDHGALLPVIPEPGVDHLPQKFGPQRILADQPWRDGLDDGGGDPGGAVAFAPADQAVIGLDLHHHRGAGVVPRARIGEGLRQRGFEDVGADGGDLHAFLDIHHTVIARSEATKQSSLL